MSSTRKASPNSSFRQERYASSPEFERGLSANLVSKRCEILDNAEERSLIYFLLYLSHQEGGLKKAVANLLSNFPLRFATRSMQEFSIQPGQICSVEQAETIRAEILTRGDAVETIGAIRRGIHFPLKTDRIILFEDILAEKPLSRRDDQAKTEAIRNARPASYCLDAFLEKCHEAAKERLERVLCDLCLNPAFTLTDDVHWYCPNLLQTLHDFKAQWIATSQSQCVTTEIGQKVNETLDYSLQERCLTLIYGLHRIGKSHAAKKWCEQHPGSARFVEVPPGTDEISFFRAIAQALGISISLGVKATQLRQRIELVLSTGHLMLVMDEAHRLWPERNYRDAVPFRVSWIMSMVNQGVPVSLITTEQFFSAQKQIERRSGWNSGQLIGRIAHCEVLPEKLNDRDLTAIAETFLPNASEDVIELLVASAKGTAKYLKGIEDVVRRSRFLARKDGRETITPRDIKYAIAGSVNPSDTALASALAEQTKRRKTISVLPVVQTEKTGQRETKPALSAPRQMQPAAMTEA